MGLWGVDERREWKMGRVEGGDGGEGCKGGVGSMCIYVWVGGERKGRVR